MSRKKSTLLFLLALALLITELVVMSSAPAVVYAAPTLDIADTRTLPLGNMVTVKGTVTVPSGVFSAGTFDQGFAIQDKSGGIYVSVQTNLGLHPRDQVEVTGQLVDVFGVLTLVPASAADVKQKGHGRPVTPEAVATGAISEATEGRLVVVEGVITQPVGNDLPYGYRLYVDDGSGETQAFIYASTGIDVGGFQPGQTVRITAFSAQFDDHYEINPRSQSDIQVQ